MRIRFSPSRLWRLAILPLLSGCTTLSPGGDPRMNEIQFLGSHNSYKQSISPALMAQLAADDEATARSLDYAHPPLREQLNLGLRKLELDVFYDPEGGRYASPLGLRAPDQRPFDPDGLMQAPGFKVLHVQDIDFRSHCLTLRACLTDIVAWSDENPRHLPLFVTINAKDGVIDRPGFVRPLKFTTAAWEALDREIQSVVGEKLLVPDDVRGEFETLREAVLSGWPRLSKMRGRILFVLDDAIAKKQDYITGHPSLRGRVMFVDVPEDAPEAAIRIVNDPVTRQSYIQSLVRQGFIVRTRSDADTREARSGNMARAEAAFRSGAQIISTDYYVADEQFGPGFVVKLPGGGVARCNPVLLGTPCTLND